MPSSTEYWIIFKAFFYLITHTCQFFLTLRNRRSHCSNHSVSHHSSSHYFRYRHVNSYIFHSINVIGYIQLEHQWIIESTYILDYVPTQNKYCDTGISMTSAELDDAKGECSNDPYCSRFYYDCSSLKFYKCPASSGLSSSGCGSIVYTKGNHHL